MVNGRNRHQISPYRVPRLAWGHMVDILFPNSQNPFLQLLIKIPAGLLGKSPHLIKAKIPLVRIISPNMVFQTNLGRQLVPKRIQGILVLTVRIQIGQVIPQFHRPTLNKSHKQPRCLQGTGSRSPNGSRKPPVLHLAALEPSNQTSDVIRRSASHLAFHIGVVHLRLINISRNTPYIPFRIQGAVAVRGITGAVTDKGTSGRPADSPCKCLLASAGIRTTQNPRCIDTLQNRAVIGLPHNTAHNTGSPNLPLHITVSDCAVITFPGQNPCLAAGVHLSVHHQILNRSPMKAPKKPRIILGRVTDLQIINPVSLAVKIPLKRLRLRIPQFCKISNGQP